MKKSPKESQMKNTPQIKGYYYLWDDLKNKDNNKSATQYKSVNIYPVTESQHMKKLLFWSFIIPLLGPIFLSLFTSRSECQKENDSKKDLLNDNTTKMASFCQTFVTV